MEQFTDFFVKALSFTTMLSLGLGTTNESLKKSFTLHTLVSPLILSFLLLPGFAFLVLWILGEDNTPVVLALLVAVASAGGASAGVFVKAVRGSESISGALVVFQALASSLYLPLLLGFLFENSALPSTVLKLIKITLIFQLIPFAIGFALNQTSSKVPFCGATLSRMNSIALALLIVGFVLQSFGHLKNISYSVWIVAITTNAFAFFGTSLLFNFPKHLLPTASSSIGIRNLTMALLIMGTFKADSQVIAPILVYGLFMYIFAGLRLVFDIKISSQKLERSF